MIFTTIEVCYLFHIQPTKYSHFICLHRPKFVFSLVCACVFMCRFCLGLSHVWTCVQKGAATIMKISMEVTERVAGMPLNSAHTIRSTVLSVTHVDKRVHFHTHLVHRHIYSALTELQTDVTFKQQSPGGKKQHVHKYSSLENCRLCRQQTNQNMRTKASHI